MVMIFLAIACRTSISPTPPPTTSEVMESTETISTPTPTPTPTETAVPTIIPTPESTDGAPELVGITGWINTEPFTLASLRGKVVLIDFWTYTCVNCIRTIPFLKEWHDKYADQGLVIIGVHSPEFEFEKKRENVEAAIDRHGLKWRIVQDNDFETWRAYDNLYWPAKYLIDKDGVIQYTHFGEGKYIETEEKIRELLAETDAPVSEILPGSDDGPVPDPQSRFSREEGQTRELYAGYLRNNNVIAPYIGNEEYYTTPLGITALYEDPIERRNHYLYLQGLWTKGPESLTHARDTEALEDYVALKFFGTSANIVIDYNGGAPFKVVATLDGEAIPETHRGSDVQEDQWGMTFFLVDEARMYRVVEQPEYSGHELQLSSNSAQFGIFAFTFGSYTEGP